MNSNMSSQKQSEQPLITPGRYKELVMNHLRVQAVKRGIAIKSIPEGELRSLGVTLSKNTFGAVIVEVRMPTDKDPAEFAKLVRVLEIESAANPCPEGRAVTAVNRNRMLIGAPKKEKKRKDNVGRFRKTVPGDPLVNDAFGTIDDEMTDATEHLAKIEKAAGKGAGQ